MKPAIALFARAPLPGRVKTRLIGRFSPGEVCNLYCAFVLDMWEKLAAFRPDAEILLYFDQDHPEWRDLAGSHARLQQGADLGQRMLRCFEEMQIAGCLPLLILGSDSPALPAASLAPWTELLAGSPALLGPAEDGGYYAIGCRSPHPLMFQGVEWSAPRTCAQTEAALRRCGLPPAYLPMSYDVDTPDALSRLAAEPSLPPRTREWLRRYYKE